MSCPISSCKITKIDESMISCWLCLESFHAKCAVLATRTVDNLREDKEFNLIAERFKKFKDLLDESSSLEDSLRSPNDNSRKRKKLKTNKTTDQAPLSINTGNTGTGNNSTLPIPNTDSDVTQAENSNFRKTELITDTQVGNSNLNNATTASLNSPRPLRVIPPMKTVFAARFAAVTSEDDMRYYIKSKLNLDVNLKIFKFQYRDTRNTASFRIMVPDSVFETVVSPDFWPPRALVQEYIYKERIRTNIAHLPTRSEDLPKN
ncbi:uncharacterized protein LOC131996929 [Stomoxys calcitrans]|uniref:uncharacterized protein LOC131996924 n=1 Tax=Stomoxys calcitrans TaxID=35570 RepID=UPI0027E340DF|nr:uncharacterized protein LOC131996924 [Stomoxys calcitrans]XP_059223113.1 uncharacterized protein LOC131996929 [Stomoxys calcitrans]